MKVPGNSSIIATPIANCWKDNEVLCVDNLSCERTLDNVTAHYRMLGPLKKGKSLCLKEFPVCDAFKVNVRRYMAEHLPEFCSAIAIIAPPESVEALERSYALVRRSGTPVGVFTSEEEARRWLLRSWRFQ